MMFNIDLLTRLLTTTGALATSSGSLFHAFMAPSIKKFSLFLELHNAGSSFNEVPHSSYLFSQKKMSGSAVGSYILWTSLYTWMMSPLYLLYTRVGSFKDLSLSSYDFSLRPSPSLNPLSFFYIFDFIRTPDRACNLKIGSHQSFMAKLRNVLPTSSQDKPAILVPAGIQLFWLSTNTFFEKVCLRSLCKLLHTV